MSWVATGSFDGTRVLSTKSSGAIRVRRERRAAFLKVLESRGLFVREGFALSRAVE